MQMTEPPILYFHADDYGMTAHGDALIRDCQTHGCLNSVSIVPTVRWKKPSPRCALPN